MGHYIQGPAHGKGAELVSKYGAQKVAQPKDLSEVPADKMLVCVVDNGPFEAAALCFNQSELQAFTEPGDWRPKTFYLLDAAKARELTGYRG